MTMLCLCKFDVKHKFTVRLDCEAQILLCVNHSSAYSLQYSPHVQMQLLKVSKYNTILLIPLLLQPLTCMCTTLMTMLCLCKSDDDAPSAMASAGDWVNHECYMQVRRYGRTTPALVPFCVARL